MDVNSIPDPRTATDADIKSFITFLSARYAQNQTPFPFSHFEKVYGKETVRDALAGVTNPFGNSMVTPLHERKALQDFSNISAAPSIRAALSQNVVQGNRAPQETPIMNNAALSDPMSAANRPNPGALTANARGSQMPNQKIGMNEALIRMGGAVSGVPMLENLGSSYGEIQDYNRAREMEAFGIEEARRKAIQDRITASSSGAGENGNLNLKDYQAKNAGFYKRMVQAEIVFDKVSGVGTNLYQAAVSNIPLAGNYLNSDEYRQFDQAKRNWVNAILRRESGAVISEQEFENAEIQYFPRPGDDAAIIEQKRQNRIAAQEGILLGTGSFQGTVTDGDYTIEEDKS